jgi:hypothetical protein
MCVSCGCGKYNEDHGDPRHLTMDRLNEAAQAANISVGDVARNIQEAAGTAGSSQNKGEQRRAS